tara:strand:- start:5530 stop:6030 length:501 start_codon:yes stop_codon:yes gene_type:complete
MKFVFRVLAFSYGKLREYYYIRRYDIYREKYDVDSSFGFNGTDIRLYGNGNIFLGKNSYVGTNSTMQSCDDCKIIVGENCQISHNVRVYSSSTDPNQDFTKPKVKAILKGDVLIGDGVWIGANVFINPGVKIGSNTVIGANSVVTKNLEANSIYGGVPAKLIRHKN